MEKLPTTKEEELRKIPSIDAELRRLNSEASSFLEERREEGKADLENLKQMLKDGDANNLIAYFQTILKRFPNPRLEQDIKQIEEILGANTKAETPESEPAVGAETPIEETPEEFAAALDALETRAKSAPEEIQPEAVEPEPLAVEPETAREEATMVTPVTETPVEEEMSDKLASFKPEGEEENKSDEEKIAAIDKEIEETLREIARLDREEEILKAEKRLKKLKLAARNSWLGGEDKEINSLEVSIDRMKNPFKYFQFDRIAAKNIRRIFGVSKAEVNVDFINALLQDIQEKVSKNEFILHNDSSETEGIYEYSLNGYYLELNNKGEVRKDGKLDFKDDKARFILVDAQGAIIAVNLTLTEGTITLREKAMTYQKEIEAKFKNEEGLS